MKNVCMALCLALVAKEACARPFPDTAWAPTYLEIIAIGPEYLDRNRDTPLPPPHASGSLEVQREILDMKIMARDGRSERQVRMIQAENDPALEPMDLFALHGMLPRRSEAPAIWEFLTEANGDLGYFVMREKWRFKRARPSQEDPSLATVIPVPPHAAYPSGHAAQSHMMAYALSVLNPVCTEAYFRLAADIGHRREVAGVHYPSDSLAGEMLSTTVFELLMETAGIRDLASRARNELRGKWPEGMPCPQTSPHTDPRTGDRGQVGTTGTAG